MASRARLVDDPALVAIVKALARAAADSDHDAATGPGPAIGDVAGRRLASQDNASARSHLRPLQQHASG